MSNIEPAENEVIRQKILVLGNGFGGTYALQRLIKQLGPGTKVDITAIAEDNYFLFSPLLHEVASGGIEARHIAYPVRKIGGRNRFKFVQADVQNIDLQNREVLTTAGAFSYDYLVLALGSVPNKSELDHGHNNVFTLRTLYDALRIKNHIISAFERASQESDPNKQKRLLTFVVSGGGYIGIQLITALSDFIFGDLARLYQNVKASNIKMFLIEKERKIVGQVHTKLGRYIMAHLKSRGIEVRLSSQITRATDEGVEVNHETVIPTDTLIWVAGVVANPRIAELAVEKDDTGRLVVNEYLELPDFPNVFVVGDCAYFEDPATGKPIPPKAHTGVRQAKVAAHNIIAHLRGRPKRPYIYSNPFEVITLGSSTAVFSFHQLRIYGFTARLIWMTGYALLAVGAYNRVRIVMDWLLSMVFGRDVTFLDYEKITGLFPEISAAVANYHRKYANDSVLKQ